MYSGSKFKGFKKFDAQIIVTDVVLQYVDEQVGFVCGYIKSKGLDEKSSEVITHFNGKIFNQKWHFSNKNCDVDEVLNGNHWNKLSAYCCNANQNDTFNYDKANKKNFIFMRWKDHILMPNHAICNINVALFPGFYYLCFDKHYSSIQGYYYDRNTKKYQLYFLNHVQENSTQIFEIR